MGSRRPQGLQQKHLDRAEGKGGRQCPEMTQRTQLQPAALHKSQGPAQRRRQGRAMAEHVGRGGNWRGCFSCPPWLLGQILGGGHPRLSPGPIIREKKLIAAGRVPPLPPAPASLGPWEESSLLVLVRVQGCTFAWGREWKHREVGASPGLGQGVCRARSPCASQFPQRALMPT